MNLLIVGAHAMDAEIMAGAFAARAAEEGHGVILFHLTRGERGHPTTPPERFGPQLEQEMSAAAAALGVDARWSGQQAPLPPPGEVVPLLTGLIDEFRPDLVVTHWKGSWHPSHRRAHAATVAAIEQRGGGIPVLYAENCEDLEGFRVDCYLPIAEAYDRWLEAVGCYELFRRSMPGSAERSSIPYWAYYTAAARVRGLQADLELAAAFMLDPGDVLPPGFGLRCR